jgi:hypothetical protein
LSAPRIIRSAKNRFSRSNHADDGWAIGFLNSLLESTSPRRKTRSQSVRAIRGGLAVHLLSGAGEMLAAGDAEVGREVARTWCARRDGSMAASIPRRLVRRLEHGRPRVLTCKDRRPHKAQGFDEIAQDDLDHPIAWIGSLERPRGESTVLRRVVLRRRERFAGGADE